jgi:hypothetical protein
MASDKEASHATALQPPFPSAMTDSPPAGQPAGPQFCAPSTSSPPPGFAVPPSYSPTPVQTQGYALASGPGGYAPAPGQAPYYGQPYSDQSGYPQVYGAGPGFAPPAGYVHVSCASPVVTTQIVSGPGVTMMQVQPANNSLIVSSMVFSITACICATLCCGLVPLLCAIPALIMSSIALCTAPAMTTAQAERKNTFARIGLILSILALLCGTALVIFVVIGNSNNINHPASRSASRSSGESCSPPSYTSSARECTWQSDYTLRSSYSTVLNCCCKAGYSTRPDCYIDGLFSSRSMCKKCGPLYSD